MNLSIKKNWYWFIGMVILTAFSAVMVYSIKRDFGNVEVSKIKIMNSQGELIVAKLFRPKAATAENPAPAVINMHAYQNVYQTCANLAPSNTAARTVVGKSVAQVAPSSLP